MNHDTDEEEVEDEDECEDCGGDTTEFLCDRCGKSMCRCKADEDGNHKGECPDV